MRSSALVSLELVSEFLIFSLGGKMREIGAELVLFDLLLETIFVRFKVVDLGLEILEVLLQVGAGVGEGFSRRIRLGKTFLEGLESYF